MRERIFIGLLFLLVIPLPSVAREFEQTMRVQRFYSSSVERHLKYAVMLPRGYPHGAKRFPVLYLLHGHTGNYRSWLNYAQLPIDTPDRLCAIVVLVDGGNGFFTNWHGAKDNRPQRWEDMIVNDLITDVDQHFRSDSTRGGRFIGGLSMGGYGAIVLALKHPKLFSFAFSSAGAVKFARHARDELANNRPDWNQPELWSTEEKSAVDIEGFATQHQRTPAGLVFVNAKQALANDPFHLLETMDLTKTPHLHLDVGIADELAVETREFVQVLRDKSITHTSIELPGNHHTPYWRNAFEHTLLVLAKHGLGACERR